MCGTVGMWGCDDRDWRQGPDLAAHRGEQQLRTATHRAGRAGPSALGAADPPCRCRGPGRSAGATLQGLRVPARRPRGVPRGGWPPVRPPGPLGTHPRGPRHRVGLCRRHGGRRRTPYRVHRLGAPARPHPALPDAARLGCDRALGHRRPRRAGRSAAGTAARRRGSLGAACPRRLAAEPTARTLGGGVAAYSGGADVRRECHLQQARPHRAPAPAVGRTRRRRCGDRGER